VRDARYRQKGQVRAPVLSLQMPRRDANAHRKRLETYFRIECAGEGDDDVRAALDALLADRVAHAVKRETRATPARNTTLGQSIRAARS
jgi:hypothetical protein